MSPTLHSNLPPDATQDRVVNLLLVDDQPRNLEVLEAILESPDHKLVRAPSGNAALLALMQEEFAAIVLDIQMPDMSGIELARLIKQRKRNQHIPILFLTAHFLEDTDVLQGYGAGAVDYLTKPINPQILRSKIAAFVELFRITRALENANIALEQEIRQRQDAQEALARANDELELRVRQRTEELSTSEARYRHLIHALPTAIYTCDAEGLITLYNQAAVELWGRAPLIGREMWCGAARTYLLDGSVVPANAGPMAKTIQSGGVHHREELVIERPDGSQRFVIFDPHPLTSQEGALIGAVSIVMDVTESKRTEAALREAKEEAEAASKAKDDFLAALSHELRTPLNPALLLTSERERDQTLPADVRSDFSAIRNDIEVEARLIDDLLDLTRISRGKLHLEPRVTDLHSLLQWSWERLKPEADQKQLRSAVQLAPETPWVEADPVRLQQVFWNIFKNAVRFTPEGGDILIRSSASSESGRWTIEVADSGVGIAAGEMERIFSPFSQGDHGPRFGGLGLGLAISRRLVELHRGRIYAESGGRDRGARFVIELPITKPPVSRPAASVGPTTFPPSVPAKKTVSYRILLVEDHGQTRNTLARLLTQRGHEVVTAETIQEALEHAQTWAFDLVLSDLGLPDGSGHDLIVELRQLRPGCRGIALSGYGMESDAQRSREAGFQMHLTKPIDIQALEQALHLPVDISPPTSWRVGRPLTEQPNPEK